MQPVAASLFGDIGRCHPGLRLLVLFGSRATGTGHEHSDWDLGVLGDPELDLLALRADLVEVLRTDAVDLVPLNTASAVLRRDVASAGQVLLEREPGGFVDFQIEATLFWCDVEPVVRRAHAEVLAALRR